MTNKKSTTLTPYRADSTRALASRAKQLLASTNLAEEVATLEPLEAYYVIKEIGLNQALPILLELNHEQLQTGIDLDCWNRYDFAADSLDDWLTAYAQDGPETLATTFLSLDYVVQLLFLAQTVRVFDPDTDEVPPENKGKTTPRAMTPDGLFLLELKTELPLKIHPYTVLDALYQLDPTAAYQLLSEVRVELPMQVEEEALRFRTGRMEDLGFSTPDDAAALFSRPAIKPKPRPQKPIDSAVTRVPSVYAGLFIETTLLQQALSLINDQEQLSLLEQEIVWAINSATIAYGEKTHDIEQITNIAERVRDTISLGLESLLAKQDPDCPPEGPEAAAKAADLLTIWSITDLFRHGFAATLGLHQKAQQALKEPLFEAWYNLSDTEQSDEPGERQERAFVTALLGRHPMRSGFDLANAETIKAFTCLADIDVAHVRLKRLVAQICRQS